MRCRWAVLLAIAGCEPPARTTVAPAHSWVYAPAVSAWPLGRVTGTIGRSQAPQQVLQLGIEGPENLPPLRLPTPWQVPGDGPARAIVYGTLDGADPAATHRHAVELIDIDAGRIRWRDTTACAGPVVGVTGDAVVCADGRGVRAIGMDGKRRWNSDGAMFVAMTDDRVVLGGGGEAVVLDASDGQELARVKIPLLAESVIAACGDAGRELFAYGQDGKLVRIAEGQGGPHLAWSVPVDTVAGIDACDGTSVLVTVSSAAGTSLVALARDTGAVLGSVSEVRGYWPARDGSARLEVSTPAGVARYTRDLATREHVPVPPLGELLARHGALRLVRATPRTAAVLDAAGVRAYLPLAQLGAAIGERAIVAASWLGSPGETVHRIPIPSRYARALRVAPPRPAVTVPAELRDLPPLATVDAGSARPSEGAGVASAIALDAREPHVLYSVALAGDPGAGPASLARFDLAARTWGWSRADGCAPGTPIGLSVARDVVVCAARGEHASVRATSRDGAARWEWQGDSVDAVQAAGDAVVVHDADRAYVLDARDGRLIARLQSDDGKALRAAVLDIDGMTLLVTAERDRVVARLPHAQLAPAWSLAIAGVVASLQPAGDGVLVALEDGDAYRITGRTGEAVAVPGLDLDWRASGDLVTGIAPGGPIPPAGPWPPPAPAPRGPRRPAPPPRDRDPAADPPVLPRTHAPPPDLQPSWQLTLYELTGGLRARNDYALAQPITPAAERSPGAPLVIQSGPGLREVLVVDPADGDPERRVRLPEDAAPGLAFSSVVDGKPVVGAILSNPLRVVLF